MLLPLWKACIYTESPRADSIHPTKPKARFLYFTLLTEGRARNRRRIERDMEMGESGIESLPDLCVAHSISLTSPRDACRLSAVSAAFRGAATSDTVWDRFLPTDWHSLVSRAVYPVEFSSSSSKRDIFFRLCDPILIDDGKMVSTNPLTLVFYNYVAAKTKLLFGYISNQIQQKKKSSFIWKNKGIL